MQAGGALYDLLLMYIKIFYLKTNCFFFLFFFKSVYSFDSLSSVESSPPSPWWFEMSKVAMEQINVEIDKKIKLDDHEIQKLAEHFGLSKKDMLDYLVRTFHLIAETFFDGVRNVI